MSPASPLSTVLVASLGLVTGCGGKVVVDLSGSGAGGASTTTGTTTTTSSTSTSSGAVDCAMLLQDLGAKFDTAQSCNPYDNPPVECTGSATIQDTCGCKVVGNSLDGAAVAAANQAFEAWSSAGCGPGECKKCPPAPPASYYCDATQKKCVPSFTK